MRIPMKTSGGYILIIETILFIIISIVITVGMINPIISGHTSTQSFIRSKQAFISAETGVEEALYRFKNGKNMPTSASLTFASSTAAISVTNITGGKRIAIAAESGGYQRNTRLDVQFGTGVAFHYGVQSGQGGFRLQNSSSITGNVFSIGSIVGAGNTIRGDVISAGPTGLIDNIHATGTAYAHTIDDSSIEKDAYYVVKTNTTVNGVSHPNSPDQTPVGLPISDEQIGIWEQEAKHEGILDSADCDSYSASTNTCTFNSSRTIGPLKIPFNLIIKSSSAIISVAGPVWVTGNISFETGPTIRMDPSLGISSVAIVADDPTNRTSGSLISIGQSTTFVGLPPIKSYVFLISQNNSAENGGTTNAISMSQGASALVAYASHGQITLSQSVSIKEVTAYKIILTQSANVTYDTGLPSVLFSAGPGGGYDRIEWDEI